MRVVCVHCDSREFGHWCSQCGAILPTPEDDNYFSILGMAQKINLNEEELKKRFFELSWAFHPDRASEIPDERLREIALRKSVLINNGFNTLRDRTRRIQYLIRQELGERDEKSGHIPMALFDLVEEINELMTELRLLKQGRRQGRPATAAGNGNQVEKLTAALEAQLKELYEHRQVFERNLHSKEEEWDALCERTQNFSQFDSAAKAEQRQILETLTVKMDEISYIDALIRRIKDVLYE